jgi:hypothetical protein
MNKKLLLEKYIKVAVRKALQEQEEQQRKAEKAMYLVYRFPGLKNLMENLMSPSFGRFVSGINLVAPKPTVFKIDLINGQDFTVTYLGKNNFSVKIAGKKYYDKSISEIERASIAIAELLEYSYAPVEEETSSTPTPASAPEEAPSAPSAPSSKDQELAADLAAAGAPPAPEEAPAEEETPA